MKVSILGTQYLLAVGLKTNTVCWKVEKYNLRHANLDWGKDTNMDAYWSGRIYRKMALQWRQNGRDGVSNHQPHDCLLNRLFRRRSKKISKLRVPGLCARNSPVTGEFPAQRASNAENVSIGWRHHGTNFVSLISVDINANVWLYNFVFHLINAWNVIANGYLGEHIHLKNILFSSCKIIYVHRP